MPRRLVIISGDFARALTIEAPPVRRVLWIDGPHHDGSWTVLDGTERVFRSGLEGCEDYILARAAVAAVGRA